MSLHRVDVVRLGPIDKHPNADTLGITKVLGFQVVVRLADWKEGDLGAYIQPDSVVDSTRPDFAFLVGHERIRVRRLRGICSMGLLVPAPPGACEGDDVAERLNVGHYEPPLPGAGDPTVPAPEIHAPKYDVENLLRFGSTLKPGERLVVTEKIHGASARFVHSGGCLYAGGRTQWLAEDRKSLYWRALRSCPALVAYLESHSDVVAYGEVFGPVQSLRYGRTEPEIVLFDIMERGEFLRWDEFRGVCKAHNLPVVPFVAEFEWSPGLLDGRLRELAEQDSILPGVPSGHLREGVVIRSVDERSDPELGRVQLKLISNRYLES